MRWRDVTLPWRVKSRDFTLLWSASAASQLGGMCAAAANPLLALVLTHSPVFAGYVTAASAIPGLLMTLPAGWLVDHVNRRLLMFAGQVGRLFGCTMVVYALGFGGHPKPLLLISALCEGTFLTIYNAAETAVVQRVVDSRELASALAANEARSHLALMAGKPLGGFLFGLREFYPYYLNLVVSLWSVVAVFNVDTKDEARTEKAGEPADDRQRFSFFDGVKAVAGSSFLRTVVVVCVVGNFFFQTVLLMLVWLAQQQGLSSARIGLLLATSGVGGLVGSIVAPGLIARVRDEWIVISCAVTWALLTLVVALTADPVTGLIAWGGLSVAGGFLNVAMNNHQATWVPDRLLGRVIGINRFLTSGATPLGALSAGYIVAELSPPAAAWLVFIVIASMTAAVVCLFVRPWLVFSLLGERLRKRRTAGDGPRETSEEGRERPAAELREPATCVAR
jgi:MFS family permease